MAQQDKPKKASYNELAAREISVSSASAEAPKMTPPSVVSSTPAIIVGTLAPTPAAPRPVAPASTVTAPPVASEPAAPRFEEMCRVLRQRIIRNISGKYAEGENSKLEIIFEGGHRLLIEGKFKFSFSR